MQKEMYPNHDEVKYAKLMIKNVVKLLLLHYRFW